jgi:hypothetical protein
MPTRLRGRIAIAVLTIVVLTMAGASADDRRRFTVDGACYCRAAGELKCLGVTTESACRHQCDTDLCDDWFWLERRACWTWGYGG